MTRTILAYLFAAAAIWAAFSSMGHAQEYVPEKHFYASFSAVNDRGKRERFVIPVDALNEVECLMTAPMKGVAQWMTMHPSYSSPADIRCAKEGEADL